MSVQREYDPSRIDQPDLEIGSDPRTSVHRDLVREPGLLGRLPGLAVLSLVGGGQDRSSDGDLLREPERLLNATFDVVNMRSAQRISPRFRHRPLGRPQDCFISEQKWRGVVTRRDSDGFVARLENMSSASPNEEAEFPIDVVDDEDLALVAEGAIFYWSIGSLDTPSGRKRVSQVRFARFPAWTPADLDTARARAEQLLQELYPSANRPDSE